MSKFIFLEDRNSETGHGWRDEPHRLFVLNPPDGPILVGPPDGGDTWGGGYKFAGCSYAWICPADFYDEHGHIQDDVRTYHITSVHPEFEGVDDMESHFEFNMSPEEMREYLLDLGMREIKR